MSFSRYHTGTDTPQIHAWGESSGSAADGNMACKIYLVTGNLPALTKVHARVTQGDASLLEIGSQDGDLLLYGSHRPGGYHGGGRYCAGILTGKYR